MPDYQKMYHSPVQRRDRHHFKAQNREMFMDSKETVLTPF